MAALYLFALLVGGGLLLFSLIGGDGADAEIDTPSGSNPLQFLSIRTLTYFLFVFGGVGALLTWSWGRGAAPLIALLSAGAGIGVAALASAAFGYLRRSDSGARESEDSFIGLAGRISIPIPQGGAGKVIVQRGDRAFELLARAFDREARDPSHWTSVVVVEMNRGVAYVSPIDRALEPSETLQIQGEK